MFSAELYAELRRKGFASSGRCGVPFAFYEKSVRITNENSGRSTVDLLDRRITLSHVFVWPSETVDLQRSVQLVYVLSYRQRRAGSLRKNDTSLQHHFNQTLGRCRESLQDQTGRHNGQQLRRPQRTVVLREGAQILTPW